MILSVAIPVIAKKVTKPNDKCDVSEQYCSNRPFLLYLTFFPAN